MSDTAQPRTAVTRLTGRTSQCTGCGEVFNSLSAFDAHRRWRGSARACLDPSDCGLVIGERKTGTVWKAPAKGIYAGLREHAA